MFLVLSPTEDVSCCNKGESWSNDGVKEPGGEHVIKFFSYHAGGIASSFGVTHMRCAAMEGKGGLWYTEGGSYRTSMEEDTPGEGCHSSPEFTPIPSLPGIADMPPITLLTYLCCIAAAGLLTFHREVASLRALNNHERLRDVFPRLVAHGKVY